MQRIGVAEWRAIFEQIAEAIARNESELTRLDSVIGDGDHGATMRRGFGAVCTALAQAAPTTVDGVFSTAGKAFSTNVGGAMGPLMGAFFISLARPAQGVEHTTTATWAAMVASGLARVRALGKAAPGDKTLVDALEPAAQALVAAADRNLPIGVAAREAAVAARVGVHATAQMTAKFGRAKFLGERALGHQDAGANTISIFFEVIAAVMNTPTTTTIVVNETAEALIINAAGLTVTLDKETSRLCIANQAGVTLCQTEPPSFRRSDGASWTTLGRLTNWREEPDAVVASAAIVGDTTGEAKIHIGFPLAQTCEVTVTPNAGYDSTRVHFNSSGDEHFFGGGERFSRVDQRGLIVAGWADDQGKTQRPGHPWSYWPVPFFISSRGYGLSLRSTYRSAFDLCATDESRFTVEVHEASLSYDVYWGAHPLEIIDLYTQRTGRPLLVPRWNNGVWHTCLGGEEAVLSEARRLRDEHIPCSALWVYDAYDPLGNIGLPINPMHHSGAYSDIRALVNELHRLGYKVQTYVFPYYYEGFPLYADAAAQGYFLKNPDGTPYTWRFHSATGPKPASILDFTNPDAKAWWQEQLRYVLVDLGFDGWMHDFAEQVPEHVVAYDGRTGRALHNAYPVLYQRAAREACQRWKADASFYARAGFTGAQAWATAAWTGDQICTWGTDEGLASAIVACLSLSLSGMPYIGPDIGGYFGRNTDKEADSFSAELWIRWTQFCALCSIMRDHLADKPPGGAEMWTDSDTLAAFTNYGRLHMSLSPYLLSCALEAMRTGAPIMRHMFLVEPDNPSVWSYDTQYLLGEALLVAPVVEKGARSRQVYFPPGQWIGFWDGTLQEGGAERVVPAPLEIIPLYVRSGTLLPTLLGSPDTLVPASDPTVRVAGDDLVLTLYLPPHWATAVPSSGRSMRALADGTYLTCTWSADEVVLQSEGSVERIYRFVVPCAALPDAVSLNGKPLPITMGAQTTVATDATRAQYDPDAQKLQVVLRAAEANLQVKRAGSTR